MLLPLLAALLPSAVFAQQQQITGQQAIQQLPGTWSSGSTAVRTGSGFANPNNLTFVYPATAGMSFSFDGNNNYEVARYRFAANASNPNCIAGTIGWVHGSAQQLSNGSMVLTPIEPGYQQVQAKCFAQSSWVENYNFTELYLQWYITTDPITNDDLLQLFQFDGAPLPPLKRVASSPNMLPTVPLRTDPGVNATSTPARRKRSLFEFEKRNANAATRISSAATGLGLVALIALLL